LTLRANYGDKSQNVEQAKLRGDWTSGSDGNRNYRFDVLLALAVGPRDQHHRLI